MTQETIERWEAFKSKRQSQYERDERIKAWFSEAWACTKAAGVVGWMWILLMVLYA